MENAVCTLLGIRYPIVQGGMVWCSGWELAAAVSNAGGLGLIGSGSMHPETLRGHIQKCKAATHLPFGVNIPLLYPEIEKHIAIVIEEKVPVVFTSAGNPSTWTGTLKAAGIKVVHVVSSVKFALKAQEAGADAIVAEGFEAGGHNGREETTTLCLVPMVAQAVKIPVIAAGGIASGKALMAALALGASGVQIGTRFAASLESSAHINFKNKITETAEGGTELVLKKLAPVRLIKNQFYNEVKLLENEGATAETLKNMLGKGRSKKGMFEGFLDEGELEIGQVAASVSHIESAADIVNSIWGEFLALQNNIKSEWNYR